MKKLTLLFVIALTLVGCNDRVIYPAGVDDTGDNGKMSLLLEASEETYLVETKAAEEFEESAVDPKTLSVEVLDANGDAEVSYPTYGEMPDEVSLAAGAYTVRAMNGELKSAGFDSPWYCGEAVADVVIGQTAMVELLCQICNVKMTIDYSEKFKTVLENVSVSATSIYDNSNPAVPLSGVLRYDIDETRAGWFAVPYNGQIKLYITATNVNSGENVSLTTVIDGVEARQWRKVSLDVLTSGDINVQITVDETILVMPEVEVVVPDNDDIIDNNGDEGDWEENGEPSTPDVPEVDTPTIVGSALGTAEDNAPFDIDQTVNFDASTQTVLDILIESQADGGIKNLYLEIQSDALDAILAGLFGITGEIDLANTTGDEAWYELFSGEDIGIIDPNLPIAGKSSHTFSVGALMSLLGGLTAANQEGPVVSEHKFILRVVDANGEQAKTLNLSLTAYAQ